MIVIECKVKAKKTQYSELGSFSCFGDGSNDSRLEISPSDEKKISLALMIAVSGKNFIVQ
jgi:hypothetical protein